MTPRSLESPSQHLQSPFRSGCAQRVRRDRKRRCRRSAIDRAGPRVRRRDVDLRQLHGRRRRGHVPRVPHRRRVLLGQHRRRVHARHPAVPLRRGRAAASTRTTTPASACAARGSRARTASRPPSPGEYFLAVSSFNNDPQSDAGEIFPDLFSSSLYPDGVVDAAGVGGDEPIVSWAGPTRGPPGLYRINVTGTMGCDTDAADGGSAQPRERLAREAGRRARRGLQLRRQRRLGPRLMRGQRGRRRAARHEQARAT